MYRLVTVEMLNETSGGGGTGGGSNLPESNTADQILVSTDDPLVQMWTNNIKVVSITNTDSNSTVTIP